MKTRTKARLIALAVSLLLAFAAAEVLARVLRPENEARLDDEERCEVCGFMVPQRRSVRRHPPGDGIPVRMNSLGFRDDEDFPVAKPAGERRIAFVGDSFLYGSFLRQGQLVSNRAVAMLGSGVRAVTFAKPGWGTRHHARVLEHHVLPVQPELVVLCFFVGNDVLETHADAHQVGPDHVIRVEKREVSLPKRIRRMSKLWRLIEASDTYARIAHPNKIERVEKGEGHTIRAKRYWEIQRLRFEQWRRGAAAKAPLDDAWAEVEKHLRAISDRVTKAGARLVVLAIPDEAQVDARKRAYLCERFQLDEKDYDLDQPQTRLAELARSIGFTLVDPLPAFREQGGQGGLYFEEDTHWNAKGHELAAALLAPALR